MDVLTSVTLGRVPKKPHGQLFFPLLVGAVVHLPEKSTYLLATMNVILQDSTFQGATHSKGPTQKLLYPPLLTMQSVPDQSTFTITNMFPGEQREA